MPLSTLQELIHTHPFFSGLSEVEIQHLLKHAHTLRVKAGHTIFRREGPGDGLYGVLSGRVAFTVGSPDGRELILNILGRGEFFGEIALLDGKGRTAAAVARDDCELLFIGRNEFFSFVTRRPAMMLHIIAILCGRLRHATDYIEASTFLFLAPRLARQLIDLLNGQSNEEGEATLCISQAELAGMLGVSRERVSRQLAAWSNLGIIRQARGRMVVSGRRHLERIAGASG